MKVFITNEPYSTTEKIVSKDYLLVEEGYHFSTSCMLASHTEEGEDVKVVICHLLDKPDGLSSELEDEIKTIAEEKNLNLTIEHIYYNALKHNEFQNNSIMDGFKNTMKFMTKGDHVFMDLSYCPIIYSNVLFVATQCALLTTEDFSVNVYGAVVMGEVMEIVSLESLLLIAKLSAKMPMGSRETMDRLLNFKVSSILEEDEDGDEDDDEHSDGDQD